MKIWQGLFLCFGILSSWPVGGKRLLHLLRIALQEFLRSYLLMTLLLPAYPNTHLFCELQGHID